MKRPKDLFSGQAGDYRRYRPSYPARLFQDLLEVVPGRTRCLDCATGNGQVARALAGWFEQVDAIDISPQQLQMAPPAENIRYHNQRAETTAFADNTFDLVTVAQGIHWFDIDEFHKEAQRVLRPGGILAIWGYGLLRVDTDTNAWLDRFYKEVVGPYWEPERRHVESEYRQLPFPWEELEFEGPYEIRRVVGPSDIAGYLYSWSATQHLLKLAEDPVPEWIGVLEQLWGEDRTREGRHELFVRVGRKHPTP